MSSKRIEDDGPDVQGWTEPAYRPVWTVGLMCSVAGCHADALWWVAAGGASAPRCTAHTSGMVEGGAIEDAPQPQPRIPTHAPGVVPDDRFASLRQEMDAAFAQAASGKGMERHGDGGKFEDQTTIRMARELGTAFPVGQAVKKLIEGERMMKAGNVVGALREWHGAMVYAAMACIVGRR